MKALLRRLLAYLFRKLQPKPDLSQALIRANAEKNVYRAILANMPVQELAGFVGFASIARDMIEARLMTGAGPQFSMPKAALIHEADEAVGRIRDRALGLKVKEVELREGGTSLSAQGAFGDIELALQNVDWRREINLSWLEFSRWGIQQIILISRLYYIKNPLLRRAIDVCAVYVFGRGVEVTSPEPAANDVLKEFFERNQATLGPSAMMEHERSKYTDGNLYFAFFADEENTGLVDVRTIDATEIQEIITDGEDGSKETLFKRVWQFKRFNPSDGSTSIEMAVRWYPAIGWEKPANYGDFVGKDPIEWNVPILHRKCGAVAKWSMGCPIAYPAIEWAKTSKEYLEACLTIAQSLAQFTWNITTKGGQNALENIKQQLGTTVNAAPSNSVWDSNPTANNASVFASGPGTTLKTVQSRSTGLDPSEVKEYRNMVGMVFGIPPTWLGDMETANLSTATTLDRPTELGFRAKQVQWEEDLATIAKFVLSVNGASAKGKLREARGVGKVIVISEAPRKTRKDGRRVYDEAIKPKDDEVFVRVTFPAIREGDLPALVKATVEAMTLDNKGGQIVGIDEREGVRMLFEILGVEETEEILDEMFPEKTYDPDRTKEVEPAPIPKLQGSPGGAPQLPGGKQPDKSVTEKKVRRLFEAIDRLKAG